MLEESVQRPSRRDAATVGFYLPEGDSRLGSTRCFSGYYKSVLTLDELPLSVSVVTV